jgi:predicted membrane protein
MSATKDVSKPPMEEPEIAVASTAVAVEEPVLPPHIRTCNFSITVCGDIRIRGPIASCNTFITLLGNHQLDLSGFQLPPTVKIWIIKICGDVKLIVPPGTSVSVNSILLCGDRDVETDVPMENGPHVTLTFIAPLCGSIKVTNDNRSV